MRRNSAGGAVQDTRGTGEAAADEGHRNEVLLVGRITAEPGFRDMASGDRLATWRMCVTRPPREGVSGRRFDAIYCVCFDPGPHPELESWRLGDVVRVTGALRRRIWHGRPEVRSMYEVEVRTAALVRRARPDTAEAPAVPHPRPAEEGTAR